MSEIKDSFTKTKQHFEILLGHTYYFHPNQIDDEIRNDCAFEVKCYAEYEKRENVRLFEGCFFMEFWF